MKLLIGIWFLVGFTAHAQQLKPLSNYLSHPRLSTEAKYFYKNLPKYLKDQAETLASEFFDLMIRMEDCGE